MCVCDRRWLSDYSKSAEPAGGVKSRVRKEAEKQWNFKQAAEETNVGRFEANMLTASQDVKKIKLLYQFLSSHSAAGRHRSPAA